MGRSRDFRGPRWYLALALLPMLAAGCDSSLTNNPANATMSVYLKDRAGDVDEVWVKVDDVVLMGDNGKVSLLAESTDLINITDLIGAPMVLSEDQELDPGTYSEARFVLGGAALRSGDSWYVYGNGVEPPDGTAATGDLQCPSCSQSGLKVKFADALDVAEGANGILLDFDVSQSFGHQAGQSGKWVMHPVIHGAQASPNEIEDGTAVATISGTVALDTDVTIPMCGNADRTLAEFVPTATATTLVDSEDNPLMFSGMTEEDTDGFVFHIDVTDFDTYTLGYQAETVFENGDKLMWTADAPATDAVADADHTAVDGGTYTVTVVTCEAAPTS